MSRSRTRTGDAPFEILQFLVRSELRVAALSALGVEPATRLELEASTGLSESDLRRALVELRRRQLVEQAGFRYEATPLGRLLGERLSSLCDSIESMRGLLALPRRLPPDTGCVDRTSSEFLIPTSFDPGAPTRRLADRLQAASRVRLLVPSLAPPLPDGDPLVSGDQRTVELLAPRAAFAATDCSRTSTSRCLNIRESGSGTIFAYAGPIPCLAGTIDELAVAGLIDDEGHLRGYVETTDGDARSWIAAVVDAYKGEADSLDAVDSTA